MTEYAELARRLRAVLALEHPPVAVSFDDNDDYGAPVQPQPAGCCFWALAEHTALHTVAADHAHCSVGSYTHGFLTLPSAFAHDDSQVLIDTGWVTPHDLNHAAALTTAPQSISYAPLAETIAEPAVVLVRLTPAGLMTLTAAQPYVNLVTKPQCQIVPLATAGLVAVSPGCSVSRVRTGLPTGELTAAIPGGDLTSFIDTLEIAAARDHAVAEFAAADIAANFATTGL